MPAKIDHLEDPDLKRQGANALHETSIQKKLMIFTGEKSLVNKPQVCSIRILLKLEHFSLNLAIILTILCLKEGNYFIPIC